ncbi:hypothetical protein [Millisia brevis]|uniref:hypothetical protein n=1 Tax=Millisia brevis TaxID=264148 RepID=UPI000829C7E5|nr:hypothetical protein [Millisia brevis]
MGATTGETGAGEPGAADGAAGDRSTSDGTGLVTIDLAEWESRAQRVRLSAERLVAVARASGAVEGPADVDAATGEYARELARLSGARQSLIGTAESWATASLATAQRWGAAIEDYRRADMFPADRGPGPLTPILVDLPALTDAGGDGRLAAVRELDASGERSDGR